LFDGGDTNLFGYVASDPVNWFDPSGLVGDHPLPIYDPTANVQLPRNLLPPRRRPLDFVQPSPMLDLGPVPPTKYPSPWEFTPPQNLPNFFDMPIKNGTPGTRACNSLGVGGVN
jgi:hypothetical protein